MYSWSNLYGVAAAVRIPHLSKNSKAQQFKYELSSNYFRHITIRILFIVCIPVKLVLSE